jgi:signal transduction histidine kinase
MKSYLLILFISFPFLVFSQQDDLQKKVTEIKLQIEQSKKGKRLMLLDRLSNLIKNKPEFKYDSIVRETIASALALDSLKLATYHTTDLIDFQNNILGKSKEALNIFEEFLPKTEKLKDNRALARFYLNGGDSYFFTNNRKTSIVYYDKTYECALKANDKRLVGLSRMYKAYNHLSMGALAESSQGLQEAILIFQEIKDTANISNAKSNLANLYSTNEFFKEAKNEREELIELAIKKKNYPLLASNYYNASLDEKTKGNNSERLKYLKLGLATTRKSKYIKIQEPKFLSSLVITYSLLDSITKAEKYLKEIESNPSQNTEGNHKSSYYEALMYLSFAKKDYQKALGYGKKYLDLINKKSFSGVRQANKFLSDVYALLGNEEMAFLHLKVYNKIKDSITSVQKTKTLSYYQTLYETEKNTLKIQAQESDIALLDEKNKVKNQWMFFGGLGLLSIFGFVILQKSRNTAKKEKQQQEQFSQDLLISQETERTRIARELHDSVGQQLTLIKRKSQNSDQEEITMLTNNALEEVRSISRGLYPALLKQLGLTESIEQLVNEYDEQTDLFFSMDLENIDELLSENTSLNFYRLVQECLTNVVKHAEAKSVNIYIKKEGNSVVSLISDNGKGFDVNESKNKNSLGLKTIFERIRIMNGNLSIDSKLNKGTSFIFSIPVKNES